MGNKAESRKDDLRSRLIDAAETLVAQRGLSGLKARDVTTAAGCALGGLYTAFEDLDVLVLHVNARTLARLGAALRAAIPDTASAVGVLQSLAQGYVRFAKENPRLWTAIFAHRLPEGRDIPDWHRQNHAVLIAEIVQPIAALRPDLDPDALRVRAQTMFAAVHGVVQLSMHGRYVGVPDHLLAQEVEALVTAMTRAFDPAA